jgi:prepilin-type N-terminal cleavage/methylation domain-containing protein
MERKMRSESGFSLVECLTALLLLGVGMAGVGTMLHNSMSQDTYSSANRRMDVIAQEIIEDLKGQVAQLRFDEIVNVSLKNDDFTAMWENSGQTGSANWVDKRGTAAGGYVYRWRVEDGHASKAIRINVTVARSIGKSEGQIAPIFPEAGSDPEDPGRFKFKVRICNFVIAAN